MDDSLMFWRQWPNDLKPYDGPFRRRTSTILEREGCFAHPELLTTVTEDEALGWWNSGVVTVDDLRVTGNDAIERHHLESDRRTMRTDLSDISGQPWSRHIWHRNPRFTGYLPKGESTVCDIAVSPSTTDRRILWRHLQHLKAAVERQALLSLPAAVSEYVGAVSGQHGQRLDVLLRCTGLDGQHPITCIEGAKVLGVSYQRMYQLVDQLHRGRDRARPPLGIWMPQLDTAIGSVWPASYQSSSVAAALSFFDR